MLTFQAPASGFGTAWPKARFQLPPQLGSFVSFLARPFPSWDWCRIHLSEVLQSHIISGQSRKSQRSPCKAQELTAALKFTASEGQNLMMTFITIKVSQGGRWLPLLRLKRWVQVTVGPAKNFNIYTGISSRGQLVPGSDWPAQSPGFNAGLAGVEPGDIVNPSPS